MYSHIFNILEVLSHNKYTFYAILLNVPVVRRLKSGTIMM
ncbi:hypothetical protein BAMA111019_21665 [Bacillus manliponensis]